MGKPSKGTSADQRLKRNNPNAGNTNKSKAALPTTKPAAQKKGGKS